MKTNHQIMPNGHIKFEMSFEPESGRNICLHIWKEFANIDMYGAICRMLTNDMNDPIYWLKSKAHPFFQSGSGRPNGDYFMIEFWTEDIQAIQDWVSALEQEYVHDFEMAENYLQNQLKELAKKKEVYQACRELYQSK